MLVKPAGKIKLKTQPFKEHFGNGRRSPLPAFLFILIMGCQGSGPEQENIPHSYRQSESIPKIDSLVAAYMKQYDIPGLSLAIVKNDSLVYAEGYGYADVSTKAPVTPSSLFRIGCLSQPITATAIMKLIQEGKISLDEKVFGDSGILGNDFGKLIGDPNSKNITVNELLHHTAGWQNDEYTVFMNPTFSASRLLSWTLDTLPLQAVPGKSFNFSLFGYLVLGEIIEKVTGEPYGRYMNSSILHPIGISDMDITGNSIKDHKKNEVTHYVWNFWNSNFDEGAYNNNISRMGAAVGWIASPTDLLKWLVRVDKFVSKPDMLDTTRMKIMLTPSEANSHFACGWWSNNDFKNWFAMSYYWGTLSELARADNGYCWAILTNKTPKNGEYENDIDRLAWNIFGDSTIHWPKKDLFEK
jgi:D-alanyl-D-alanine carboxypeptidase